MAHMLTYIHTCTTLTHAHTCAMLTHAHTCTMLPRAHTCTMLPFAHMSQRTTFQEWVLAFLLTVVESHFCLYSVHLGYLSPELPVQFCCRSAGLTDVQYCIWLFTWVPETEFWGFFRLAC